MCGCAQGVFLYRHPCTTPFISGPRAAGSSAYCPGVYVECPQLSHCSAGAVQCCVTAAAPGRQAALLGPHFFKDGRWWREDRGCSKAACARRFFSCVCSLPPTVSSLLLLTRRITNCAHHQRADLHTRTPRLLASTCRPGE